MMVSCWEKCCSNCCKKISRIINSVASFCWKIFSNTSKVKYNHLSHNVVTLDIDCDILTTYCWSLSGDEVDCIFVTCMLLCSAVTGWSCTIVIQVHLSDQFPSLVHCRMALLLLCFLIIGIQACGISIPLSLLMLLRWSYQWIASFTWVNWSERCTNPSFGIPFSYGWAQEHVGDMSSIDFFTWRGLAVCDPHPQWPFCETKDYISLLTTIYFTT